MGFTLTGNPISAFLSSASQTASSTMANLNSVTTNLAAQNSTETLGNTVSNSMDQGAGAAEDTMTKANEIQNRLAIVSATMQVAALARSMMMQALRDMIKDAKDTVKDQGEAGHKP
jgi:uncharacterized BrkB/YihY/UPF0761 family membrane protein